MMPRSWPMGVDQRLFLPQPCRKRHHPSQAKARFSGDFHRTCVRGNRVRIDQEADGAQWAVAACMECRVGRLAGVMVAGGDGEVRCHLMLAYGPAGSGLATALPPVVRLAELRQVADMLDRAAARFRAMPPCEPAEPLRLLARGHGLTVRGSNLGAGEGLVVVARRRPVQRLIMPGEALPSLAAVARESHLKITRAASFIDMPANAVRH